MALLSLVGIPDSCVWTLDRIFQAREFLVTSLLEVCTKLVDRYDPEKLVCRHALSRESSSVVEDGKECDTIVYGSLIRGLNPIGIWPSTVTSSDIRMSVSDMMRQLKSIHCYKLKETRAYRVDHSICVFTTELQKEVDRIKEYVLPLAMDMVIDESYRKHMEEQARK